MHAFTRKFTNAIKALIAGDYEAAYNGFETAKGVVDTKFTPERFVYETMALMAKARTLQGRYAEASALLEELLAMSDDQVVGLNIYTMLEQISTLDGNAALADTYRLKRLELTDSINTNAKTRKIADMSSAYHIEKMDRRTQGLLAEKRQQTLVIIVAVLVLLVVSVSLVVVVRSRRRLRASYEDLYELNQRLLKAPAEQRAAAPQSGASPAPQSGVRSEESEVMDSGVSSPSLSGEPCTAVFRGEAPEESAAPEEEDAALRDLHSRLLTIMEGSAEVLSNEFSIGRLADMAGEHVKKVSRALNEVGGSNFNTLLQTYRIREACRRLSDVEHYGQFSIEAIADEVGFKSRSNFNKVFKAQTGLTPSAYLKIAKAKAIS